MGADGRASLVVEDHLQVAKRPGRLEASIYIFSFAGGRINDATLCSVSIVLILAGFLASRAALAEAGGPKELKAQKWLLYSSLIIVYFFVLLALLTWPLGFLLPLADAYEHTLIESVSRFDNEGNYWIMAALVTVAGLGLWWSILAAAVLKLLRVIFDPFTERLRSKRAIRLLVIGLAMLILSAGTGIVFYQRLI
jgi:hypothetical protein